MLKSIIITDQFYALGAANMKIVLVDDEQLIVDGLKKIISRQFPNIETAAFTDPFKALDALKNNPADLLITDIRMPEMTGLQLIRQVREAGVRYCSILTGLNDVPLLQESIRMQVCDYLIKPVNKEELYSLIRRVRDQVARDSTEQTDALAEQFCSGTWDDSRTAQELASRMRRSDCPPLVLAQFIRSAGREMTFWEVCGLAVSVVREELSDAAFGAALRMLSVPKQISSPEIRKIIEEFELHYAQDLTVGGIAAEMHLQPNYLTTLFKKETGKGFVQCLNERRISEACRLILTHPAMSVQEAGERCGFSSPRYFFTVFKKLTEMTPGAFRSQMEEAGFIRL